VSQLTTHFRGLFVAIVALAISAGAAFAWGGPPPAASDGLATAADATGKTLPARADEAPNAGTDEDADEGEALEAPTPEDATSDTHGSLVSDAAAMETPEGFSNHGEFVSCVARMNHGHEDPDAAPAEPVDLTTLTPEDCGITPDAASQSTKAPKANGKTKDHSSHGKAGQAPGHSH
jgi:hypothetical protein